MKKHLLFLTGFLLLLLQSQTALGASSSSSSSAPSTLYDRIKNETAEELTEDVVEPEIAAFVRAVMQEEGENISEEHVTAAVKNELTVLCGSKPSGTSGKSTLGCDDLAARIRNMVMNERRVRSLARSLQLAATSYELPISHLPGRGVRFTQDIRGIINIWAAESADTGTAVHSGTGSAAPRVRTQAVDEAAMEPLLQTLGDLLRVQPQEQQTAAVWRYQYGVRLVQGERAPDYPAPYEDAESGPGTERQYLFEHWLAIEDALTAIWEAVKDNPVSPPLKDGEVILYVFPEELLKRTLPDNVLVWLRTDGPDEPHLLGDSGLQWVTPLEPVLPSLVNDTDQAIKGGTYPPEPIMDNNPAKPADGRGLCSDPQTARGYLCRPFEPAAEEACPDDPANPIDDNKISLVTCEDDSKQRRSLSGPDVCRGIEYIEADFDPQRNCRLDVYCADSCGAANAIATASFKNEEGTITLCIDTDTEGVNASYVAFHELIHAYQFCHMPPRTTSLYDDLPYDEAAATCCRIEGEAYRAQCDMFEQDGSFDGEFFNGVPINAETCAEISTDAGCKNMKSNGKAMPGCYMSQTYPAGFHTAVYKAMENNPKNVPESCPDVIDPEKMDPRLKELMDAIENRPTVCQPGQIDRFANRIGNNMCYIGQCVEATLEQYRMTGAQSPIGVSDEGFPWNDPKTGAPLGNAILNPPLTPSILPLYRPQLVVQELEKALCQLAGLPPLTPSILCTYNPGRNLMAPVSDYIDQAQSFLEGKQTEQDATSHTLALALGLGSRLGTTLYAQELQLASRSLSDILNTAVGLFKEMGGMDFPTEMCPTDNTLPTPPSESPAS